MKRNIFLFFVIISFILTCCKNINTRKELKKLLEYYYDLTSYGSLNNQFFNLGFEYHGSEDTDADKKLGFTIISISGVPVIDDDEKEKIYMDDKLIILSFSTFFDNPPSKWYRKKIRKILVTNYGEPEVISFKGQRVPLWNFAVLEPDLPIERWELEDRYLYLNDYRKWYNKNVFEIRIKMK
jgi:hypothetical protein